MIRRRPDTRVASLLAACLLGLPQLSCALANPPAAPVRAQAAPMSNSFANNDLLIQEVGKRLAAMLPAQGTLAVLVQLGQGPAAARAKADLLASLAGEKRIVWSQVTSQPGGPVADTANPGQHVNTVNNRIEPKPQVVLLVNVSEGRLYMAARPPGADPLGPPTAGWTWVLNAP